MEPSLELSNLPEETQGVLLALPEQLSSMLLTVPDEARNELEKRNISRRQIWGDRAVAVPIIQGNAHDILSALIDCIAADYRMNRVSSMELKETPGASGGIRKVNIIVTFQDTFGRHEILRVSDDTYYLMPCSKR